MDEFYTVNQAAIVLKIHPLTVRRYINEGRLKAFRVGGNVRIAVGDLRVFVEGFTPHPKMTASPLTAKRPFSFDDPLFRLRAKGLSLGKLETEQ